MIGTGRFVELRSSPRMRGPRLCSKNWVPASAGTSGDGSAQDNKALRGFARLKRALNFCRGLCSPRLGGERAHRLVDPTDPGLQLFFQSRQPVGFRDCVPGRLIVRLQNTHWSAPATTGNLTFRAGIGSQIERSMRQVDENAIVSSRAGGGRGPLRRSGNLRSRGQRRNGGPPIRVDDAIADGAKDNGREHGRQHERDGVELALPSCFGVFILAPPHRGKGPRRAEGSE